LSYQLFVLGNVVFRFHAGQLLFGAADGVALIVKKAANLADGDNVGTLVVAAVAAALYRGQASSGDGLGVCPYLLISFDVGFYFCFVEY
jgi:hypothetical protein